MLPTMPVSTAVDEEWVLGIVRKHKAAEDKRANRRNKWRVIMLAQTIVVWFLTTLFAAKFAPGFVFYAPLVPLIMDLAITVFNWWRHY